MGKVQLKYPELSKATPGKLFINFWICNLYTVTKLIWWLMINSPLGAVETQSQIGALVLYCDTLYTTPIIHFFITP